MALDSLINSFIGGHQNQSAQSYSAAVARDLSKMNQIFTTANMQYAQYLNSLMMSQEYSYNKTLAQDQFNYSQALQGSAYQHDKALAAYSYLLNNEAAQNDYSRSVKYISDSLNAYKNALIQNGYNPLLALGSSAAQYAGHQNGVNASSVASGGVGLPSVSGGKQSGSSPASASGVGVPSAVANNGSMITDTIKSAFDLAKVSSEIQSNEAQTQRDKASAAESLERAKTESVSRDGKGSKTTSETVRNYGSVAASVAAGIGTAFGAKKASDGLKAIVQQLKDAAARSRARHNATAFNSAVNSAKDAVATEVGKSATSANVGSTILRSILPLAAGLSSAVPLSYFGAKEAGKRAEKNGDQRDTKWFFPGSMFY